MKRRKFEVGTRVKCFIGTDGNGQYWWVAGWDGADPRPTEPPHGPFKTKAEAEENFRVTVLGPQCDVKEGGAWDPAWDEKQ